MTRSMAYCLSLVSRTLIVGWWLVTLGLTVLDRGGPSCITQVKRLIQRESPTASRSIFTYFDTVLRMTYGSCHVGMSLECPSVATRSAAKVVKSVSSTKT